MKRTIRLPLLITAILAAVMLSACGEMRGAVEEKYDIHNSTIVYFDQGSESYANTGKGTDENTVYELGSNGKTLAAYTALAMVGEGILELDGKISSHLDPELVTEDVRLKDITLRQLLCHTAGFSPSFEFGVDKKIYTDPGTAFCYSGVGYIYLQNVIENAGGMPLDQAASKYVFEPLGMKNSGFENIETIQPYMNAGTAVLYALLIFILSFLVLSLMALIPGRLIRSGAFKYSRLLPVCFLLAGIINTLALLFLFSSNFSKVLPWFLLCFALMGLVLVLTKKHPKLRNAVVPAMSLLFLLIGFALPVTLPVCNTLIPPKANCAYTFRSTGRDMALFCNELMEKAKEKDGVFSEMFAPAVTVDECNAWGLGIAIENAGDSPALYWHSGINPGFQSLYVLVPDENRYIIILTNSDRGLDYSKETARTFLGIDGTWDIKR
ncbi:MAG: serine hydrolase [Lachnospiraceae bacterium]|nr:serine hydrolase [Lachnospiraceae bacterium]